MVSPPELLEAARGFADRLTEIRRELHAHPELDFDLPRTAALVERELAALGLVTRRYAGTGVSSLVEGERAPGDRRTIRCVGLRADMDALPIEDAKTGPVRSAVPGVMHACGHDAHTACLLGAARLLAERRAEFAGSVRLIFQPAEETDGGALPMIEEGVMDSPRVDAMFGLHTDSSAEAGVIRASAGCVYAASNAFDAVIRGGGGHGAHPEDTVDVIYVACKCVDALQSVVSRNAPPLEAAVVTVGAIHAGTARNIIPTEARLSGTIRTMSPATRELAIRRVREIIEGVCRTFGAELEYEMRPSYPTLINAPSMTELVREAAAEMLGAENVTPAPPSLGVEDFAYYAERAPACFFKLGTRCEARGIVHPAHSALFDVDESALPIGSAMLAAAAMRALER